MYLIPSTMAKPIDYQNKYRLSHPSSEIRGTKSTRLAGKRIVIGVTGSIAAVETIKLIRELIRHGAEVYPVMTVAATKLIHPWSLQFASGNEPVLELTGNVEHVALCGDVQSPADLLLIAPCTANTVSKIAMGIDDTPVTTFATTAIGSGIPIIIIPAMHGSMYKNSIIQDNIKKLKKLKNVEFIDPLLEGGKAKFPGIDEIVARVTRRLWKNDLKNQNVLIIAGSTAEPLDDVRLLTNRSSGKTGIELAKNAYYRGANVKLWYGNSKVEPPSYIPVDNFESVNDLEIKVKKLKFNIIIICAAISDYYANKTKGKIKSNRKKIDLKLKPTPKIILKIRQANPRSYIVGYKLKSNVLKNELVKEAIGILNSNSLNMVIANDLADVSSDSSRVYIIKKKDEVPIEVKDTKSNIAERIFDEIIV
jgi:phosphopantothenoylcysteine decarboxylase/phosphopantothenate--cysteine ligase